MKLASWIIALIVVVAVIKLAFGLRQPMALEKIGLELGCPFVDTDAPAGMQAQCFLYSRFGVISDSVTRAINPAPVSTCSAGYHYEPNGTGHNECILDGQHSVGNGESCPDGSDRIPGTHKCKKHE